jgi:hypothetical protein
MVKPTGWVVDMRHYIHEDTGDLPDVIRTAERVLSLAIFFGAVVAGVTDLTRSTLFRLRNALPLIMPSS